MSNIRENNRRAFLASMLSTIVLAPQATAQAAPSSILEPKGQENLMRVRIEMEVKGNVRVPSNPLVSRKSQLTVPILSDVTLDYEERYRKPANADPRSEVTCVERFYHTAKSRSTLNKSAKRVSLRESAKRTVVRRETSPEVIYSVDDYLTHQELGLLRAPVCSASVDQLLPMKAVSQGEKYEVSTEALMTTLNLTSVETTEVIAEVKELKAETAKLQLTGNLQGTIEGVPTKLRVLGKITFNRVLGTCTWVAIALHETREIGNAEPGFDVAATIKMVRQPLKAPIALPKKPAPIAFDSPAPKDRLFVELSSEHVGVSTLMDRHWRMMKDVPGSAMMRLIENDISIAQCNFRTLASLKSGQQWTLEAFQEDTKRTIGDQFKQLVSADQSVTAQGLRLMRLVADGVAEGVPVRWIMLHFSDDSGRRVLATFTMSGNQVHRFAGTDTQLADSLRLTDVAREGGVAGSDNKKPSGSSNSPEARVSRANLNDSRQPNVQSSSDQR